tara:strand:- start:149 stop:667 length:519 start_codon:yes stop_codon:yes gene_type:complete
MDLETAAQYAEVFGVLTIIGAVLFSWYQIRQLKQDRKSAAAFELTRIFQSPTFAHGLYCVAKTPEGLSAEEFEEFHQEDMSDVITLLTTWESLGAMIFRKELDWDLMYDYFAGAIVVTYLKTERVIADWRTSNNRDSFLEWMQWLAERVMEVEDDTPTLPAHVLHKDWSPSR